jgi:hypothetical protein
MDKYIHSARAGLLAIGEKGIGRGCALIGVFRIVMWLVMGGGGVEAGVMAGRLGLGVGVEWVGARVGAGKVTMQVAKVMLAVLPLWPEKILLFVGKKTLKLFSKVKFINKNFICPWLDLVCSLRR